VLTTPNESIIDNHPSFVTTSNLQLHDGWDIRTMAFMEALFTTSNIEEHGAEIVFYDTLKIL